MSQSHRFHLSIFLIMMIGFGLACSLSGTTPTTSPPAFDPTKMALEFQATQMSQQLTQAAQNVAAAPTQPPPPSPLPQPTSIPATAAPTEVIPTPTPDFEAQMKEAKILVYENTDERGIGLWIKEALNGMGLKYTHTGSYSGHFMEYLNSGTIYDLIIVGAEDKDRISGEFWDQINTRLVRDKAALIAEVWYLDSEANGPISKILSGCGVRYERDWDVADSIYWWEPTHPVFNEPNTVLPLIHYNRFWANQTGDKIRIGSGGDATLLAGIVSSPSSNGAVLATCYEGRVILQTFSDHDYRKNEVIPLWQNYIYNTLKNHFLALDE